MLPAAAALLNFSNVLAVEILVLTSPDGRIAVSVDDSNGLSYSVQVDGAPLSVKSNLGLILTGGTQLGMQSETVSSEVQSQDSTWQDPFGKFLSLGWLWRHAARISRAFSRICKWSGENWQSGAAERRTRLED